MPFLGVPFLLKNTELWVYNFNEVGMDTELWVKCKDKKKFGIIICMNLKQCGESSIFINYNSPFSNSDTELWYQFSSQNGTSLAPLRLNTGFKTSSLPHS